MTKEGGRKEESTRIISRESGVEGTAEDKVVQGSKVLKRDRGRRMEDKDSAGKGAREKDLDGTLSSYEIKGYSRSRSGAF